MTWVTAALLLTGVLVGYLAWVWVPAWVTYYEVRQVVRDYGNQAVKNPNDAELVAHLTHKLAVLQEREVVADDGRTERIPVVRVEPQDVVWERNAESATLHVAFEYVQEIRYPLVERSIEKAFQVDMTVDVSRPDWGPLR